MAEPIWETYTDSWTCSACGKQGEKVFSRAINDEAKAMRGDVIVGMFCDRACLESDAGRAASEKLAADWRAG